MQIPGPTIRHVSAVKQIISNEEDGDKGRSRIWVLNKASMQNQKTAAPNRKSNGNLEF